MALPARALGGLDRGLGAVAALAGEWGTDARGNVLVKIGGRPAYEVLVETLRGLSPDVRDRAARNLLVGLAWTSTATASGAATF